MCMVHETQYFGAGCKPKAVKFKAYLLIITPFVYVGSTCAGINTSDLDPSWYPVASSVVIFFRIWWPKKRWKACGLSGTARDARSITGRGFQIILSRSFVGEAYPSFRRLKSRMNFVFRPPKVKKNGPFGSHEV